jgi:hypothetical protein
MRLFLIKLTLFLAPLVGAWLFVEWQLNHVPIPYTKKAELLEQKSPTTRILVLGSSLEFEDIAPSEFDCDGLNMANQAQSLFLDSEIVRRWAPRMPELRLVIQGVSYGSFECQLSDTYLKSAVYLSHHYLGTGLDGGASFWDAKNFSLIAAFGQDLVLAQILTGFRTNLMLQPIDDYGWGRSEKGLFDPSSDPLAAWDVNLLHTYMKPEHIPENVEALERMITQLQQRNVQVVLVTSPVSPAIIRHLDPIRLERARSLIADFQTRFGVTNLDYSSDPRFVVTEDFSDLDHLNPRGATKYSRILNEEVVRPRRLCGPGVASR